MDFGSNSVLERVGFGLKCVLHIGVRVPWCCHSRVIQNPAERTPPPWGYPPELNFRSAPLPPEFDFQVPPPGAPNLITGTLPPKIRVFRSIQHNPYLENTLKQNKKGLQEVSFCPPLPEFNFFVDPPPIHF